MNTNHRSLDVVEARAIIGLPEVKGVLPNTPDLSRLDRNRLSPSGDKGIPPSIRESGGTLKSRFAAIARKNGARRKDTRDPSRSLLGRRANLEGSLENGNAIGGGSGVEKGTLSLPIQRYKHLYRCASIYNKCDGAPLIFVLLVI